MTPLAIQTLLDIHCSFYGTLRNRGLEQCGDLVQCDPRVHPIIFGDGIKRHGFILSSKGRAMVKALTNLPVPEKKSIWTVNYSAEFNLE